MIRYWSMFWLSEFEDEFGFNWFNACLLILIKLRLLYFQICADTKWIEVWICETKKKYYFCEEWKNPLIGWLIKKLQLYVQPFDRCRMDKYHKFLHFINFAWVVSLWGSKWVLEIILENMIPVWRFTVNI